MYQWNNEKRLKNLKAKGQNNILTFEAGKEKAKVYLKNRDIEKVIFSLSQNEWIITKNQRHHVVVGEKNTQRDVYHYFKKGGPAPTMRIGITKHKGVGTWSSLPHPFELQPETGFEEVFFYLLKGGTKRALQIGRGVWYNKTPVDSVWPVNDHSFSVIPMGYHPIVAEPSVYVSYVWVYLAKKAEWEKL